MSVVAAAIIGSAVVGAVSSNNAADSASDSAARSTDAQERVGMAQLEQSKIEFAAQQERAAKMDALTEKVTNSQLASQQTQTDLAKDYADYNKNTFRPLEQGLVSEAENYDTPAEQERVAGAASASVEQNFAAQRAANTRDMARMGINPNSGRFQGAASTMAANEALAEAGAENNGRQSVKQLGWAKRMDAASLGRNLPSAQATSAGLALTAGNSAVGNQATANSSFTAGQQPGIQLLNGASGSFGSAAANYGSVYGAANQAQANTMSGIGSAAGMLMKYYGGGV